MTYESQTLYIYSRSYSMGKRNGILLQSELSVSNITVRFILIWEEHEMHGTYTGIC